MIVGAFATSHAYTFQEPETWDVRRERSKTNVSRKAGKPASDTAQAQAETLEDNRRRYAPIREAHEKIRAKLKAARADAVLLIGDDQAENFTADNMPQLLIYTGDEYVADDWDRKHSARIASHAPIARRLVEGCMEEGFDVAWSTSFRDGNKLLSHAHTEPILYIVKDTGVPAIPVFVNAVHPPAPSAARCYAFGQALARVIQKSIPERIVLCASGGLSHFSPSHPWAHHVGSRYVGDISVEFDRKIVEWMRAGEGEKLARFSSDELIENGEAELRQWIVMLGALGSVRPEFLVYEPLYRSIMGMGVGWWSL